MPKTSKIRIFADVELKIGQKVDLSAEQSHYLLSVMRAQNGNRILVFNGKDGEFECSLIVNGKKDCALEIITKTRDFAYPQDIWLMFAPLKKDRTDFVIEKATELGVAKIVPVITRYAISDKIRIDRWKAQAIEAAEQSRRVEIPTIVEPIALEKLLSEWNPDRKLYFMDETMQGTAVADAFQNESGAVAFLIGPEGGFAEQELQLLRSKPYARAVNLGPRILRAETAAVVAICCWQALNGDWK